MVGWDGEAEGKYSSSGKGNPLGLIFGVALGSERLDSSYCANLLHLKEAP